MIRKYDEERSKNFEKASPTNGREKIGWQMQIFKLLECFFIGRDSKSDENLPNL